MSQTIRWLLAIAALAFGLAFVGCSGGDGEENGDADQGGGPVRGEKVLGDEEREYKVPHVFSLGGEDTILFRNDTGISAMKLNAMQLVPIDTKGLTNLAYGPTQYAVDESYLVWNIETALSYRFQWALATTQEASTGPLAPGFCIRNDSFSQRVLTAVQRGGYMYNIALAKFTDPTQLSRITLLDPDQQSTPVSISAFACKGAEGFVGATDGRMLRVNLNDSNPTLEVLFHDGGFDLLQYDPPYLVWLDQSNDIRMYNLETGDGPKIVADVDPNNQSSARVDDLRLFGSVVVWSDNSEGNYNVWAVDLATQGDDVANYPQITRETSDERFPFLYGGKVYWEDHRNDGRAEIWADELPPLETTGE
ncbi:MAG: hypothetical protein C4523_02175 [Myxococcales bacterium]|nr:MAG: hypothetical protein C4523_02175 [Myxococcales bacterium]